VCTAACNPNDQSSCPANGKCVSTSTGSFCFPACGTCTGALSSCVNGSCRSPGGSPACTPPGTPTVVLGGMVGPGAHPACDPAHAAAVSIPALASQSFGIKNLGNAVSFSVPPGTGSMSILSQGANVPVSSISLSSSSGTQVVPNSVVPTQIVNPSNAIIFDDTQPTLSDGSASAIFYGGLSPLPAQNRRAHTST